MRNKHDGVTDYHTSLAPQRRAERNRRRRHLARSKALVRNDAGIGRVLTRPCIFPPEDKGILLPKQTKTHLWKTTGGSFMS